MLNIDYLYHEDPYARNEELYDIMYKMEEDALSKLTELERCAIRGDYSAFSETYYDTMKYKDFS